jgi:lysophospholipase L1-like esterase
MSKTTHLTRACVLVACWAVAGTVADRFQFGEGKLQPGYTRVLPATVYSPQSGYGFENGAAVAAVAGACTSDKPFFFSVDVPEGNYSVKVTLGHPSSETVATVRAESRRLMIERLHTAPGKFETRTFTVNVRSSEIGSAGSVRLKPREIGKLDWDHKLTLEFNGERPSVSALEITRADDAITVYLAGDSTVVDQDQEPWAAWGQMLPRFFKPGVAIANHAESGEALKSFVAERRLEKILSTIKAGDYLFIQFAHNDQKPGGAYVEPFTTYKEQLQHYIGEARRRGAIPILVTSMHRRSFDADGKLANTLGDYPAAIRQTAAEEKAALIDLNAMSKAFYEALGPEGSAKAFVIYPAGAFPGQTSELKDNSHFNNYGAYELARCIVEGIKVNKLGIAKFLADDGGPFDPGRPDPPDRWSLPLSPIFTTRRPEGS